MKSVLVLLVTLLAAVTVQGHTYHLGACPTVEPVSNFEINKFLGQWFVVQKSSTASGCLTNNYTRDADGDLRILQTSEHFLLGIGDVDHVYRYSGKLSVPNMNYPATMRVRFPFSVAGDSSYTVFATDYENYAGVFTCQRLTFAHRQSASILSRTPTLDKASIDKIRNKLNSFGVNPHDLSIIKQTDCKPVHAEETGININIDESTLTAGSVASVVRKAGEKIGDGIETVAEGVSNVYNRVSGGKSGNLETSDNDAEWLP